MSRPFSARTFNVDVIEAIASAAPIDWDSAKAGNLGARDLASLQLLADVAAAFRGNAASEPRQPIDRPESPRVVAGKIAAATARGAATSASTAMFAWGPLQVQHEIGRGSYGVVYWAWDPWLARPVALKLTDSRAIGAADGLAEARRLARVRHRNVLLVHGAAAYDGKAGLWSELIDGRTLGEVIAHEGRLSVEETLRIARDLAFALSAVHRAGLVHGDVKADNVMRESGGRIVLMDFGAAGDERLLASRRVISATVRYLPPEVLDGDALSTSSDIWALSVLTYLLLSGRLPWTATDANALREAQRAAPTPLRTLREDVPRDLSDLLQRCLSEDRASRITDTALLADAFSALLRPVQRPRQSGLLRVSAAAVLAVAAATAWQFLRVPVDAWQPAAQFLRQDDAGVHMLKATDTVAVGDHLRLRISTNRNVHFYVLNEDATGRATVLFPLPGLANPLPAGQTLELPGGLRSSLAWQVTTSTTAEEFLIVAALQPLPLLEESVAQWERAHFATTRSVGELVDAAPAIEVDGTQLRSALATLRTNDPNTQVWRYRFAHADVAAPAR